MESTLSVKRAELAAQTGVFLGYGRGADYGETAWTTKQQGIIDFCVNSGCRQVYFPPVIGGVIHEWSFLKPIRSLTLLEGASTIDLPDDFSSIDGKIMLSTSGANSFISVEVVGVAAVYARHAAFPDSSGRPVIACQEPMKGTSQNEGQRWQLKTWPSADQDYTVQIRYYLLPNATNGERPYVYGGAAHSETFLASCIAAAELYQDDMRGPRWEYFMERLGASIALDRRAKAQKILYNDDRSDGGFWIGMNDPNGVTVTIDGVTPE